MKGNNRAGLRRSTARCCGTKRGDAQKCPVFGRAERADRDGGTRRIGAADWQKYLGTIIDDELVVQVRRQEENEFICDECFAVRHYPVLGGEDNAC